MARSKKTSKKEAEIKDAGLKTEVVDLDKKLEEAKELSGTGIQAFMREAIKNATKD